MITILLQKILTSLTSLLTGLVTSLTAIDEALDVPVIVKTVTGAVCNFTANIARRCYSVKTTISASGGGGTPSEPVDIVGSDSVSIFQSGSNTSQFIESVIEFDDTCYGGEIDIISGKLKITNNIIVFDGSDDEDWSIANDNTQRILFPIASVRPLSSDSISNYLTITNMSIPTVGYYRIGNVNLIANCGVFNNVAAFKTWLSEHNLEILYPLAEPIIIDVSAINITPEIGENNIWSDSGNDTTVIYFEKLEV